MGTIARVMLLGMAWIAVAFVIGARIGAYLSRLDATEREHRRHL